MLRRRYYQKEKTAGKTKGRKETYASVRNRPGSERGVYRCAENGFLNYERDSFSFPPSRCLSFTGHRILSDQDRQRISRILPGLIEEYYLAGKDVFLSGGALGFDTIAARTVLQMKAYHPEIKLVLAIPCPGQSDRWQPEEKRLYHQILLAADQKYLISEAYSPGCMQKRNQFMIDHSDICLCYLKSIHGGTWNTVSYAYDHHLLIRNIAREK